MSPHRESSPDEKAPHRAAQRASSNGTATQEPGSMLTTEVHATSAAPSASRSEKPRMKTPPATTPSTPTVQQTPYLTATVNLDDDEAEYDLICVGFGPASIAVAVAMHDALEAGKKLTKRYRSASSLGSDSCLGSDDAGSDLPPSPPKVLFIEKQARFAWHAGMLLPGAKMQISFIKDLATLRDPRSRFTFLSYLHHQGFARLVDFVNLGTFLPARAEYEDYLRWCAAHFAHLVRYGHEVLAVSPVADSSGSSKGGGNATTTAAAASLVRLFAVEARDAVSGKVRAFRGRNVLVAAGGSPSFPACLSPLVKATADGARSSPHSRARRILHSSEYAYMVPEILTDRDAPYRVVVVGAGQSAAEIFHNIQSLYPNSRTRLVMRQEFLRPSDDSPFVNSIFNPEYIDSLFPKSAKNRSEFLVDARATNYGVVRLELIEELFDRMYHQKRELGPDERTWPHRILGGCQISSVEPVRRHEELLLPSSSSITSSSSSLASDDSHEGFTIKIHKLGDDLADTTSTDGEYVEEQITADLIIAATGYRRNAHIDMLRGAWGLLPKDEAGGAVIGGGVTGWNVETEQGVRKLAVGRDYRVRFAPGTVAPEAGIWLQGCCEGTHGLSDTLLSVLATRSGEIVESIFGTE